MTDLANLASVVVYAINPAGLETLGDNAEDKNPGSSGARRMAAAELGGGLSTLAHETGGLFLQDTNDIHDALARVLEDQSGYYLIGYKPDESLFKPDKASPKFHKIQIKVKRPGLNVRSREGFFAVAGAGPEAPSSTEHDGLASALSSPFAARDFAVRLTSLFGLDPRTGPYVRSLLHIDLQGMTFQEQADGSSQTKLEIAVITFGVDGFAVERVARSVTIPEFFEGARRDAVAFTLDVPVKKPGPYQVRAAVRELASARLGSASQFLEVPNLGTNRLALSGLVISGAPTADGKVRSPADRRRLRRIPLPRCVASIAALPSRMPCPSTTRAHLAATAHADLLVRPSLYRDDHVLQSMPTTSFDGAGQPDPKHLELAGFFRIDATTGARPLRAGGGRPGQGRGTEGRSGRAVDGLRGRGLEVDPTAERCGGRMAPGLSPAAGRPQARTGSPNH